MKREYVRSGVVEAKRSKCSTKEEVVTRLKSIFASEISIAECYKVWNIIKQTNKNNIMGKTTDLSITDDKALKGVKSATRRIIRGATLYTDLSLYKMGGKVYGVGYFNDNRKNPKYQTNWLVAVEIVGGGKSFKYVERQAINSRSSGGILHHLHSPFSDKEFIKIIEK